jgi:predicted RNA-binding Zn-ribbon protein involved in translation (DUF1610 family)
MKPRRYTDEQLKAAVESSYTMRAVLQELGLKPLGGNYETVEKRIRELGLDTSHFLGSGHLKGKSHNYGTRPLGRILVHLKLENTWRLRNRLIREQVKPHQCERCGNVEWLGQPIPLELHHKDGDRTNNRLENLEFLCPNCHAATDNYRGSKKKV